jgi:hypothetical protein
MTDLRSVRKKSIRKKPIQWEVYRTQGSWRLITHARNPNLSRAHLTGDRPSPVVGLSLIEGISGIIEVRSFDYRLRLTYSL